MSTLTQLVDDLKAGRLRVVDLTQPLGPETPVIGLPPIFAASPGVTIGVLSKYDNRGPAWYWNALAFGEHTGTHFDAPVHWVTGKDLRDNACDTIPARRFVGPACVIDVSREVDENPDFLLLAKSFGVEAHRIASPQELRPLLRQAIGSKAPVLIEVVVAPDSEVSPWEFIHPRR